MVIHIAASGQNLISKIIGRGASIPISTAVDGEALQRGRVYIAPADHHLLVIGENIRLGRGPRENMARPAIDPLFRSVAASYGPRVIGLVLTGLLDDGAAGFATIKRCGGVTVVQNPSDTVAASMPLEALRASDVDYRASVSDLAELLVQLAHEQAGPAVAIPDDVKLEVEIALGRSPAEGVISKIGDPAPLSCPSCGGVLSQLRVGPPLRFRCQVGHGFTAESLASEQEGSVDEALRLALRIIREREVLLNKMALEARQAGRNAAATDYEKSALQCRANADVLRHAAPKN